MTYWANLPPAMGQGMVMLGHIWSLSIEEQFYILWPIVTLSALRQGGLRAVAWTAGVGFGVSALLRVVLTDPGSS